MRNTEFYNYNISRFSAGLIPYAVNKYCDTYSPHLGGKQCFPPNPLTLFSKGIEPFENKWGKTLVFPQTLLAPCCRKMGAPPPNPRKPFEKGLSGNFLIPR